MKCKLVDVFAEEKFSGNGLAIFYDFEAISTLNMQKLTQEIRQFESIFVTRIYDNRFSVKIFTMEEELDFAGHPLIGLGAHLHEEYGDHKLCVWEIELNLKTVIIESKPNGNYFSAKMNQGKPSFMASLNQSDITRCLEYLSIEHNDLASYELEVISTGLPYLIIPVRRNLKKSKICKQGFGYFLRGIDAKFVYLFDVVRLEGRTWDNRGLVEDIATGSAAGPVGAFMFKHEIAKGNKYEILQGRFVGRPSKINIELDVNDLEIENVFVSGKVCKVADVFFES